MSFLKIKLFSIAVLSVFLWGCADSDTAAEAASQPEVVAPTPAVDVAIENEEGVNAYVEEATETAEAYAEKIEQIQAELEKQISEYDEDEKLEKAKDALESLKTLNRS